MWYNRSPLKTKHAKIVLGCEFKLINDVIITWLSTHCHVTSQQWYLIYLQKNVSKIMFKLNFTT